MGAVVVRRLVVEGDRTQLHQSLARVPHALHVLLETHRRGDRAELAVAVDVDRRAARDGDAVHARQERLGLGAADTDRVGLIPWGDVPYVDVVRAGCDVKTRHATELRVAGSRSFPLRGRTHFR